MAYAPLESIPVGKMARYLCLGGLFWVVKIDALLPWKVYHVDWKMYTLWGPIAKLKNQDFSG